MIKNQPDELSLDFETPSLTDLLGSAGVAAFQQMVERNPENMIIRGTLHRAGRTGFYHWHEQRRDRLGWDDRGFRYAPVKRKISLGLATICDFLAIEKGISIQLQEQRDLWLIEFSPQITNVILNGDYLAGFVQEFCSWAGLGKFYRVKLERESKTATQTCRVMLYKDPLDD